MNKLPINEEALKIVTNIFNEGRIRNVAYLVSHYNQKELMALKEACSYSANMIQLGIEQGVILESFDSMGEVIAFQSFLITQGELIERSVLYNEGILIFGMKFMEGNEIPTKLHQN